MANTKTPIDYKGGKDLEQLGYKLHHTATHAGYHSRKYTSCEMYSGKFGDGFKIHKSHPKSTQYHIVEYWIKENEYPF